MSQRVSKIAEKYTERDFQALYSIYKYRCLSFDQLYEMHYRMSIKGTKEVTPEYFKKKIVSFKKDNFIEEEIHNDRNIPPLFSLTTDGIKCIKEYFNLPSNIYDENKRKTTRGYLTYSEVKISYKFMPHQYNLNCFAIDAKAIFDKYNMQNEYFDEKHIPSYLTIRPDGMTITDKFDIFYEMDMGTETKNQLNQKWEHYRAFLRSSKNDPNRKKIIMFICRDKGRIDNRISLIKDSVSKYFMDCLGPDVEMYIGTPKKLTAILKTKVVQEYFGIGNALCEDLRKALVGAGYQVADGEQLKPLFANHSFLYYIKSTNNDRDFMVSEFFGEPISTIYNAQFYNNLRQEYIKMYKKETPLLVVATSEETIIKNLEVFNVMDSSIFYTTIERLKKLPFHQAIFKYDHSNMYCFDATFTNAISAYPLKQSN